jgi:Ca2+-binding RTX toxin-like protein
VAFYTGVGGRAEKFDVHPQTTIVTIKGGAGDDFIWAGQNNDSAYGGLGRDIVIGYLGNDMLYGDDNASSTSGSPDQVLGGYGADTAYGGAGDDYMNGEWDNDTLHGDAGDALINGGFGADKLYGGSGDDFLFGGSSASPYGAWFGGPITVNWDGTTGNAIPPEAWTIAGEAQSTDEGDDTLNGGPGNDTLTGGLGVTNVFVFDSALSAATNVDHITDFYHTLDEVRLDKTIFKKLSLGPLDTDAFVKGAKAKDREDRILYQKKTGAAFYDADGTKSKFSPVKFAIFDNKPKLSAVDFDVIA